MDPYRPFYKPHQGILIKTSADIIREARLEMATRPVDTKRPFTPRDRQRTLFGKGKVGRPPSSISLHQVKFNDIETIKLPPLKSTSFKTPCKLAPWKLPDIPSCVSTSLMPEEIEIDSWPDRRLTRSSPQERTDFSETFPRSNLSLYQRGRPESRSSNNAQRRLSQYRILCGRSFKSSSIKETDENDDLKLNQQKKEDYFKTPTVQPLNDETDINIDNKTNEKKEDKKPKEKKSIITEILNSLNHIYDNGTAEEKIDDATIIPLLKQLYNELKNQNSKSNKTNLSIIKTLYKFVEKATEVQLLNISKILLTMKVKGTNLSSVMKLIFQVSRSDKNDALFLEEDMLEVFVESLGRASPMEDAEACIYGYGALKFLTMNQQLLLVTLKLGILELMILHLKIVNNARLELIQIPEQTSHAMFQLTGTLRNVASEDIILPHFIETGAIGQLCTCMELFNADLDLISNLARIFSILSTHDECCDSIVHHTNSFRSIINIFSKYPGRQDIIVRFGYALGNIIGKSYNARIKLYKEANAMSAMLNILENYLEKDLEQSKSSIKNITQNPDWASDGSIEDVIIKIIRIIANMSMHPEVGLGMTCVKYANEDVDGYTSKQENAKDGEKFINLLLMILRRKSVPESEELVMSTLSSLNNLSYYAEPEIANGGPFAERQHEIAQVLGTLLISRNEDCIIEVTRVLGNLTRSKDVRDYILETGGIRKLVNCLEYENKELLFTTTGVLVNLLADWDKRLAFKECHGIERLIIILKDSGDGDWRLASLVCQALWNFCIDSTHLYAALGIQPTNSLLSVLVDLMDEEKLFGITEGSEIPEKISETAEYQLWEQFANVATNLLEKIEQYLESMQAFEE